MKKNSTPANIGENIRKFREIKNITRDRMAHEMGLSLSGYSKIERNQTDLTLSRIQQIAQILEVDIFQILSFDATHIFNISNNHLVQSNIAPKTENMNFHNDDYKDKYIQMLEAEIARLKKLIQQ